jgi:exo-beta-1,3-glucanase (GH17 family)
MNRILPYKRAICYSGFRDGQSPESGVFPSYDEVKEDLQLLAPHWDSLRLYDCDPHAETVFEVIRKEGMQFDVMLGAYIMGEMNNYECPWGGMFANVEIEANIKHNDAQIKKLIAFAKRHEDIISSVSVGNEATVNWTDHMVSTERVVQFVQEVKANVKQPVTFCENYVPWLEKIKPVGEAVDFISIHTYPVWEYKSIDEALDYTKENFRAVQSAFPDKQIVITEAGWTTKSNGRGIEAHNANEHFQKVYIQQLQSWAESKEVLIYVFEAFDENWKGSNDPLEPEKHWGLYSVNRTPKKVLQKNENRKEVAGASPNS